MSDMVQRAAAVSARPAIPLLAQGWDEEGWRWCLIAIRPTSTS